MSGFRDLSIVLAQVGKTSRSGTGRWLSTEEHILRDMICRATHAGNIEVLLTSSN